jgi:prolyl 4-hydroxylase
MPNYTYITDQIFTVDEFFTPQECENHIALAETTGFDDAPINSAFGAQIRKDVRNNTRVMIDDELLAANIYSRIQEYIPLNLGGWTACGFNDELSNGQVNRKTE